VGLRPGRDPAPAGGEGLRDLPAGGQTRPDFGRKNLLVYARYFDLGGPEIQRRADELLAMVQLTEKADGNIRELSGGMKRRLMLARALLNQPRLLVLDEPTTGLDPQARHLIWQRVRSLKAGAGVTVLLTTHYLEEASQLCDRVILMDGGGSSGGVRPGWSSADAGRWWRCGPSRRGPDFRGALAFRETDDRFYVSIATAAGGEEMTRRFRAREAIAGLPEDVFHRGTDAGDERRAMEE
jgi:energy-coupling factor transporter ATP-binding protein EcfA2